MKKWMLFVLLVVLATASATTAQRERHPNTLEIDESRNPELIPEWYVWHSAFESLHYLSEMYLTRYSKDYVVTEVGLTAASARLLADEGARSVPVKAHYSRRWRLRFSD